MRPRNAGSRGLVFRLFTSAGAGSAAALMAALVSFTPAPARASAGTTATLVRNDLFLSNTSLSSTSNHPIRRRAPYHYYEEERRRERTYPYGFMNIGGGVFDPANQPGNGFYANFAIGSEVSAPLDIGAQVSWYHRSSDGEELLSSYTLPNGTVVNQVLQTQSVDTDLLPLMGIVRLKFPIAPQFTPYVGGGAGYEWLWIEGTDQDGVPFSNDYAGFGAQLMGGVNVWASPTVGLYGEATYNFSTLEFDYFDPALNAQIEEQVDMDGLAVHGGLRFRVELSPKERVRYLHPRRPGPEGGAGRLGVGCNQGGVR